MYKLSYREEEDEEVEAFQKAFLELKVIRERREANKQKFKDEMLTEQQLLLNDVLIAIEFNPKRIEASKIENIKESIPNFVERVQAFYPTKSISLIPINLINRILNHNGLPKLAKKRQQKRIDGKQTNIGYYYK